MRRKLNPSHMPIAVAIYLPEQYSRLLATADDTRDLEATWQEWHEILEDTRQKMAALGMHLIDVTIDLDALEKFCLEQGLKNTSETRARFAAHILSEQHQQQARLQQRPSVKLIVKKKKRRQW